MDYNIKDLREKIKSEQGQKLVRTIKKTYAEDYEKAPLIALTYSKFKLFCTTGNRSEYESEYFQRRRRWTILLILAMDDDRYLKDLENLLSAICDEFSWALPAHSIVDREKGAFDYTFIDLFAAETAFYLGETAALFGDKLSFDIRERMKYCIKTKIADDFENRKFWWEDVKGSNWAAVCAGSIGIAYMYAFPERFTLVKDRIFAALKTYTDGLRDDGFSEEGVEYCIYGLGFLLTFVDVYLQKYGNMPECIVEVKEKVLSMLDYYMNGILDGRYIPFGDVSSECVTSFPVEEFTFKKLFPDRFLLADYDYFENPPLRSRVMLAPRLVDGIGRFEESEKRRGDRSFTKFYKSEATFLYQSGKYAFATKGGNNGEMHNHNDVGAFSLSVNGKRIVADLGAGKYSYEYFRDATRYGDTVFVCGSQAHSVPIVGGEYQKFGKKYAADLLSVSENGVSFDIAKAYGAEQDTLKVSYECQEKSVSVNYEFASDAKKEIAFRFVCDSEPEFQNGKLFIEGVEVEYDKKCAVSILKREYETPKRVKTAYLIDFSAGACDRIDLRFCFKIDG